MANSSDIAQSDLAELLNFLGMGDHARPQSPHEVFQEALDVLRKRLGATGQSAGSGAEAMRAKAAEVARSNAAVSGDGELYIAHKIAEEIEALPLSAPDSTRTGQGEAEEREPITEAQIRAGVEELAFSPVGDEARTAGGRALVRAIYRAMLAARPAAPEAQ